MVDTPTSRIVADAAATVDLTDSLGNKLVVRKLKALDLIRLFRAMGPDQSDNQQYMNIVSAAVAITKFNGIPKQMPLNERMIDALVVDVGDEAIGAVMAWQLDEKRKAYAAANAAVEAAAAQAESGEVPVADPLASGASATS